MASVKLEKVVKRFGTQTIVKGLDLTIEHGEFIVLVGPSGCGKSTTLRMIAGLEDISDGTIEIAGRVVNDVDPKDRDIAMVFQSYALYPHLNVYDNMAFGLKLRGLGKEEIKTRVESAAATLDITHLLQRKPKALSGGQRQRVAMGRAIVRQPKVFLFDEPLSNLDAQLRTKMRTEIKKLMRGLGVTAIYVTHDQTEAMTMADRIVILKHGDVMQIGSPTQVYEKPQNSFVAQFIGNPAMNLIPWQPEQLHQQTPDSSLRIPENITSRLPQDRKILVGFRPQDLQLAENFPVKLSGVVEIAEVLGGSTLLELQSAKRSLLATVHGHQTHLEKKTVELSMPFEALHFFAEDTGLRLDV